MQLDNKLPDIITFRIAAWNTVNLTALFSWVTGVIKTFQSVVPCTATQLWAAISKYDLTRLKHIWTKGQTGSDLMDAVTL